jgi:type IV secretory pathway TrbL component
MNSPTVRSQKSKFLSSAAGNLMANHGGYRNGAGRPTGVKNRSSHENKICLTKLAREHTHQAIEVLVDVALTGRTDAARVTAACAILDRGYGKPTASEQNRPEALTPTVIELVAVK